MMTTTKKQLLEALQPGDTPDSLICVYQAKKDWDDYSEEEPSIIQCSFSELSDREYSDDYGGVEGDHVVAFSKKWIYIKVCYDGAEWFAPVPRTPQVAKKMKSIVVYGGG